MAETRKPDGARTPSREEVAKRDLGHTRIRPAVAWFLTLFFLAVIYGVPLIQIGVEWANDSGQVPSPLAVGTVAKAAAQGWNEEDGLTLQRIMKANAATLRAIDLYEDTVEDRSFLTKTLLGPVQLALTSLFNLGNEQAYLGRNGWMFFRSDVDHLTAPGFLSPAWLEMRLAAGNEYREPPQPDPRKAIVQFHQQLAATGRKLIIVPTPVKPALEGDALAFSLSGAELPLRNVSFNEFVEAMRRAGVEVFDPAPLLARQQIEMAAPVYLRTDTHWTFKGMQGVARALATFLDASLPNGPVPGAVKEVTHLGDIAQMLRLPEGQQVILPETQTVEIPESRPNSEQPAILLLGDSFTNIYSMEALGWGANAGLGEQLEAMTQREVRKIAINAGGAHAARRELVRRLLRGDNPLAGVDTVIWQFANRELSQGDWQLMELPEPAKPEKSEPLAEVETTRIATATVKDRTLAPAPGSVPYPDCLVSLHLTEVESSSDNALPEEILVFIWGLRDGEQVNQSIAPGDRVRLEIRPWDQVEEELGSLNREELLTEAAFVLDLFWAGKVESIDSSAAP